MDYTKIIQSLGEIYSSLYYIDLAAGSFVELSSIADVHAQIGASGDAQDRLNYFCHHLVTPDCRRELLAFVDLSTLNERLGNTRIVTKQFHSTLFSDSEDGKITSWRECSFIECDRDGDGRLAHVIFCTQSIHDTKLREQGAQQKLRQTNAELTGLLAAEKQHTAIIGALSNVYFAIYYIHLEENSFQEIVSFDHLHHELGEKRDARNALNHIAEVLAGDAHRPIMRGFMDFDTIDARLGTKSIIVQEFAARNGGWIRSGLIPVERTEDGKNRTVLCTLRWITVEKEERETQDNLIQALAIPYENIYAVNMNTREAICYRMGQTMNDRYGKKFAAGDYEDNISMYIENDVLAEDRHLFDQVRAVSGVSALLENKKTHSFTYRVFRNDRVQYFQCQLVKPNLHRNEFVIAFKNIHEEKNQELAQQRKVEEAYSALEKVNASLKAEMAISGALSQEYSSLFKIDARSGKISLYRTDGEGINPQLLEKLMQAGDYEAALSGYIDALVVPEDRERLRASSRLSVLLERVPEVGLYKLGYRRIMNGVISYYEMNTARTVDENGEVTFILALRDVDEEMRRQLKQTREMEMQREIIEGLGSEYYSVLLVDPKTDMTTVYRAEEEDGRAIAEYFRRNHNSWSKGLGSYCDEVVSEASRAEFMEKLCLNHIRGDGRDYSFTYERLKDGGRIQLSITEKPSGQPKVGCFEFVFEDNGIGMSEEFLGQIFKPFTRAEDGWVSKTQGTGLGMSISRNIVRMMGGDIKVESKLGVGSRFTVTIYLKLQDDAQTHYDRFADLNVLVADDDAMSLESCCSMLDDLGMKAEGVATGAQAVDRVVLRHRQKQDYFACIIDWKMPGMDGIATTRAIRRAVGDEVPIIIISAYGLVGY